jgi:hypothetical protein
VACTAHISVGTDEKAQSMTQYLEFEKPLAEIEGKAEELRALARETKKLQK